MNHPQPHRFYYMKSKHRLFIICGALLRMELFKLCRNQIKSVDVAWVTYTRRHDPFTEEIDLTGGIAAKVTREEIEAA